MATVTFKIITFSIITAQSYYLSPSLLTPEQSISYCRDHCGSDLASFHSFEDYQKAIATIQLTLSPNLNESIWIGLITNISDSMINSSWSDGTPFDFASDRMQYPWNDDTQWRITAEHYGNHLCTYIDIETDSFTWQNVHCYDPTPWPNSGQLKHPLCNHCNGALNKYILRSVHKEYQLAQEECQSLFGTSLGSIHTSRDFYEAQYLCAFWNAYRSRSEINCWLGANDEEEEDVWVYEDGSMFDLGSDLSGGEFPWYRGRPDNSGGNQNYLEIAHDKDDLINDVRITDDLIPICNYPSALCESMNIWMIIEGESNMNRMDMDCAMEMNGSYSFVVTDKQWDNDEDMLQIDYLLSIIEDENRTNGTVEIVIYDTFCQYLVYGIGVAENIRYMFIGTNVDDNYTEIGRMNITNSPQYSLNMKVNDTGFILTVGYDNNLKQQLAADFSVGFSNRSSGYIGLRGIGDLHTIARSLYVSGTVTQMTDDNTLDISENCNPTTSPTVNPTQFYSTTSFITTDENDEYGIIVVITFHYPFDANNTKSIVTILNSSLTNIINDTLKDNCVDEYKITPIRRVDLNITILNVTMIVCDKTSQNQLISAIETDNNLQRTLVTKINKDPDIPLSIEDDIINVDTDKVLISTEKEKEKETSITSTNSTKYDEPEPVEQESDEGWKPDLVHIILAGLLVSLCLFLGIVFMWRNKNKNDDIIEKHMSEQVPSNSVGFTNKTAKTAKYHSEGNHNSNISKSSNYYTEGTRSSKIQPGTGRESENMKINMMTPGGDYEDEDNSDEYVENDDAGSMEKESEPIISNEKPYKTPEPPPRKVDQNMQMSMDVDQIEMANAAQSDEDVNNEHGMSILPGTATGGECVDHNTSQ